jgi:hypothetical protein
MKREILFRGKREDTEIWVTGNFVQTETGIYIGEYNEEFRVLPETVGQYIGLKGYTGAYKDRHKNEVKLFEGDVVEAKSEGSTGTFVITWRQEAIPCFILFPAFQEGKMWSIAGSQSGRHPGDYYDDLRLIGNIFDNPQLQKNC